MTTAGERDRHQRVQALFLALADQEPGEQERALSGSAEDAEVVAEVRELLGLDRKVPAALDAERVKLGGDASLGSLESMEEPTPEQVGSYRVLRLLGRGGMGSVYEAEQQSPRRRVALKLLHGAAAVPEVLRRFQHEAEVLARLQHPGIAQIIEAGTFEHCGSRRPFFAMESVDGRPLDEFADARELSRRDRLELFVRICDAVHHAHRRGVVHRDLKPANVLVQEDGRPKVLDFGIARLVESGQAQTQWTAVGQVIGTLGYMSPEQARGETQLDTSSDVYSLGVVLYELLGGRMPYEVGGMSLQAAVQVVAEVEPPALGSLDRGLRGDLETIVGRAMQKDPEERYDSAAALAEDVRRHLRDEPIHARPPTTFELLRKFARRHRTLVGAAVLVLLSLGTGLVVSLRSLASERDARADEIVAREVAEHEATTATAINEFLLQDMLRAVNPLYGGRHVRVAEVLDAAGPRIDAAFAERPLVRAAVRLTLGSSYRQLGLLREAEPILAAAAKERRERLGADHLDTLEARYQHVITRIGLQQQSALDELRELIGQWERQLGTNDTRTLRARGDLGSSLALLGHYEESIEVSRAAHQAAVENHGATHEISQSNQRKLAEVLERAGRYEESAELLSRYLAARVERHGDDDPKVLELLVRLVHLLSSTGELAEAERLVLGVIPRMEAVFGADSIKTLGARNARAGLLDATDRTAEATALHREVCEGYERALGRLHPYTLLVRNNLAIHLRRARDFEEAERLAREVLDDRRDSLGPRHEAVAESLDTLAAILQERGRLQDAAPLYEESLSIARDSYGPEHPRTVDILFNRASLALQLDDHEVAEREFRALIAADSQLRGAEHPYIAAEKHQLGEALVGLGRHEEAIAVFEESIALRTRLGETASWRIHSTRSDLGGALLALEQYEEAEDALLEAYEGLRAVGDPRRFRQSGVVPRLVKLYEALGEEEEAERYRGELED